MLKGQLSGNLGQGTLGCYSLSSMPSTASAAPQTFLATAANYSNYSGIHNQLIQHVTGQNSFLSFKSNSKYHMANQNT